MPGPGRPTTVFEGSMPSSRVLRDSLPLFTEPHHLSVSTNMDIRKYITARLSSDSDEWLLRSEIPDGDEMHNLLPEGEENVTLPKRCEDGKWESFDDYLRYQYGMARANALRPLKLVLRALKKSPHSDEPSLDHKAHLYEEVRILGFTTTKKGIAAKVSFSTRRSKAIIDWMSSKRLTAGALVLMTPADDMFKTKTIPMIVAARPLEQLNQNPPKVDLFFASPNEIEIDPDKTWFIVQDSVTYFEADRHSMVAIQRMGTESFPLHEHIVNVDNDVGPPMYTLMDSLRDLSHIFPGDNSTAFENFDILSPFPENAACILDDSQKEACHNMLSSAISIIQGPPGTGKTKTSVVALETMVLHKRKNDNAAPIIVASHTNHALDQLLTHSSSFGARFIRLGGRSDDAATQTRTLYEVRKAETNEVPAISALRAANRQVRRLSKEIADQLDILKNEDFAFDTTVLMSLGVLSIHQVNKLQHTAAEWGLEPADGTLVLHHWAEDHILLVEDIKATAGFELKPDNWQREVVAEEQVEEQINKGREPALEGDFIALPRAKWIGSQPINTLSLRECREIVDNTFNLYDIPVGAIGSVFQYFQNQIKLRVRDQIRGMARALEKAIQERHVGAWERDLAVLSKPDVDIIGLTITGLAKYRGLISCLKPTIVMVEEAAETLESSILAACVPSLQHLILVGDHKQLRPHVNVRAFEEKPWFLNISLFERLINNGLPVVTLQKQRRMHPEIRRLLFPIYGDAIEDHEEVTIPENRPIAPGMGFSSYWWVHSAPDSKDDFKSSYNLEEVKMVAGLVEFLNQNGTPVDQITVLTFYNAQRTRLIEALSALPNNIYHNRLPNVKTVDSFQGEENEIVILSLVKKSQLGFLGVANRVCVALSRARRGFYIVGNAKLLYGADDLWRQVIRIMQEGREISLGAIKSRIGDSFPITCTEHGRQVVVRGADDWAKIDGGCTEPCDKARECGHACPLRCHPFQHAPCEECPGVADAEVLALGSAMERVEVVEEEVAAEEVVGDLISF